MIVRGDCVEVLRTMSDASIDAVITDPPYGIGFMGHEWDQPGVQMPAKVEGAPSGQRRRANPAPSGIGRDGQAMEAGRYDLSRSANQAFQDWCEVWARECLRVLKPGGHIAAFGGARTSHRLACAIEDAGFEIRDSIMWLFGAGFPKSLNVGTATGHEDWEGWGTALKPAHEPIVVGRKPLIGSVSLNVLTHGTGALNIDACRVATDDKLGGGDQKAGREVAPHGEGWDRPWMNDPEALEAHAEKINGNVKHAERLGRWPANVVMTHTERCVMTGTKRVKAATGTAGAGAFGTGVTYGDGQHEPTREPTTLGDEDGFEVVEAWECVEGCPVRELDEQTGMDRGGSGPASGPTYSGPSKSGSMAGAFKGMGDRPPVFYGDTGGASRFFYCGKTSRAERNAGLDDFEPQPILWSSGEQNPGSFQADGTERAARNHHATVKPIDLMRWLVRLLTPPGGKVLDPFMGSGTTGCACALEGVEFVGIERDLDKDGNSAGYIAIAEARIAFWSSKPTGIETERVLRAEAVRPERTGQLSIL